MEHSIRTLTPLHIGNGKSLQVSDYTILDGKYFRIDIKKVFALLVKYKRVDDVLDEIERTSEKLKKEKDNRQKIRIRKELDILEICRKIDPVLSDDIAQKIDEYSLYQMKYELPDDEYGKLIDEQLKSTDHQVYIPGSTIKGAIRTALLANVMKQLNVEEKQKIIRHIDSILDNYHSGELKSVQAFRQLDNELVEIAFHCGFKKKAPDLPDFHDVKYDLLKLLFLQDSSTHSSERSLAAVNLKRYAASKGKGFQKLHNPCEAIRSGCVFTTDLSLMMNFMLNARMQIDKVNGEETNGEYVFGENVWIDFERKIKRLYEIDCGLVDEYKAESMEQSIINHIYACCKGFYREVVWHDRRWVERAKLEAEASGQLYGLEHFYEQLEFLMEEGAVLLKTGFGSGFHAKTVMLMMMLDDTPENRCLKDSMKRFMETFKIGKPQNYHGPYTINLDTFPTSRPLVEKESVIDSLGWVLLHHEPIPEEQQKILATIEQMCLPVLV